MPSSSLSKAANCCGSNSCQGMSLLSVAVVLAARVLPRGIALKHCRRRAGPAALRPMGSPFAGRRLHLIGVGGAGMSGLALVARSLGAEVTGSDRAESSYTERLRESGLEPRIGHSADAQPAGAE